jgi:transcriptional regulator with XRE-family HTH domain
MQIGESGLARQSVQGNSLTSRKPDRTRSRQRNAVVQPVINMRLLDASADLAGEFGLRTGQIDGFLEGGDCVAGGCGHDGLPIKKFNARGQDTAKKLSLQAYKIACMQTLGEAVKELRESLGWSQSELARRVTKAGHKVAPPNIQQLEAGDVSQPRYLPALAAALNMTIDDLLAYTRLGIADRKDRPRFSKADPASALDQLRPITVWENADDLPADAFVELPRISLRLSGGRGGPSRHAESLDTGQAFRADFAARMKWKPATHYSMICEGHSMEPTIMHRAPVVVDTSDKSIKSGQIYAIVIDDEPRLKRLDKLPGGMVRVRSDNTSSREYDPYEIRVQDLEVIGRAVWTASLL